MRFITKLSVLAMLAFLAGAAVVSFDTPRADAAFTDTDADGAIDVAEDIFGSNPNSSASTPEAADTLVFLALPDAIATCSDGMDNDADGVTDLDDTGCLDADGDSLSDQSELALGSDPHDDETFPEDSRLTALLADSGYGYIFASYCLDEEDNDGDGLTDADDPGCAPLDADNDQFEDHVEKALGSDWSDADSEPEHISVNPGSCGDGLDNDSDGQTDGADEGCVVAPNDDFADAMTIDSLPFSHTAKATGASVEFGERVSDCSGFVDQDELRSTVWYKFTAPSGTHLVIDATGTDIITSVSVWHDGAFGLTEVDCLPAFFYFGTPARLAFEASAGETYYVQIERLASIPDLPILDLARLSVHIDTIEPPANDDFANAALIASLPFTASVDSIAASTEGAEPEASCRYQGYPASSAWYRYTPSTDTYIRAGAVVPGTDFSVTIGAFEGTSLASLTQIACGSEALAFHALAGHTYYLQAAGYTCQFPGDGSGSVASFCIDSRGGRLELKAEAINVPACGPPQFTIPDRTGDQIWDTEQPDILSVSGSVYADRLCVTVHLDRPVPLFETSNVGFDLDQDMLTGSDGYAHTVCRRTTGLGVEDEFFLEPADGIILQSRQTSMGVIDAFQFVNGSSYTIILPVATLANDTNVSFVATALGHGQSSDCAPDGGHISCENGACAFHAFRNGDANCATGANAIDAAIVLQHSAGLLSPLPCPDAADVDGNGVIDSRDAALILQFSAGLLPQLPPEECFAPPEFC